MLSDKRESSEKWEQVIIKMKSHDVVLLPMKVTKERIKIGEHIEIKRGLTWYQKKMAILVAIEAFGVGIFVGYVLSKVW